MCRSFCPVEELPVVGVLIGHARSAVPRARERAEHLAQDGVAPGGVGVEARQEVGDGGAVKVLMFLFPFFVSKYE